MVHTDFALRCDTLQFGQQVSRKLGLEMPRFTTVTTHAANIPIMWA